MESKIDMYAFYTGHDLLLQTDLLSEADCIGFIGQ